MNETENKVCTRHRLSKSINEPWPKRCIDCGMVVTYEMATGSEPFKYSAIEMLSDDASIIAKYIRSIDFLDAVARGGADDCNDEADKLEAAIRRLAGLEVSNG